MRLFAVVALALVVTACAPAPRHVLTTEEKVADMHWLFSQFNENYAPLEYKQSRFNLNYRTLKDAYLAEAKATATNQEFYLLMHRFVSEFKDAHTSSFMLSSDLPERTTIAYLGFATQRKGDMAVVTKLLPINEGSFFPVKVGDVISKIDGRTPTEIVTSELSRIRDLGALESNLTYHFTNLSFRNENDFPMPAKENAVITVIRDKKEVELVLPWIRKDLGVFMAEQAAAAKKKLEEKKGEKAEEMIEDQDVFTGTTYGLADGEWSLLLQIAVLAQGKIAPVLPSTLRKLTHAIPGQSFLGSFVFVDTRAHWASRALRQLIREASTELKIKDGLLVAAATPLEALKAERNVPANVIWLPESKTYPIYLRSEKAYEAGKETGKTKMVAVMRLDTFSPATEEKAVMKEVGDSIKTLKAFGVRDLVIDLINNGGGSLVLGANLAQALTPKRLVMSEIQFGLNETWIDDFEMASRTAPSDSEREIFRRVFETLKRERLEGKRLSSPFSVESIMPYQAQPNADLEQELNIVLVVNEMCASMCDIFTAILKDNGAAKVVGTKTMGAGGNVVLIMGGSPNARFNLQQTESLILRRDGSYIENNGVDPDVSLAVNEGVATKYDPAIARAISLITGAPEKKPE